MDRRQDLCENIYRNLATYGSWHRPMGGPTTANITLDINSWIKKLLQTLLKRYSKSESVQLIPIISPALIIIQKAVLVGLISEGRGREIRILSVYSRTRQPYPLLKLPTNHIIYCTSFKISTMLGTRRVGSQAMRDQTVQLLWDRGSEIGIKDSRILGTTKWDQCWKIYLSTTLTEEAV